MMDSGRFSSHALRWVTGLALAVPLLAVLVFGPLWTWSVLVPVIAAWGLWEYRALVMPAPTLFLSGPVPLKRVTSTY